MSLERVVEQHQYWRLASAQLSHIDLLHLLFNLSALWSVGLVETAPGLGVGYYAGRTALLFLLSPLLCMGMYFLAVRVAGREEYRHVTAVGYSCVLFGWMALLAARQPGGWAGSLVGGGGWGGGRLMCMPGVACTVQADGWMPTPALRAPTRALPRHPAPHPHPPARQAASRCCRCSA